ncbi:MAG: cytochrome c [Planctomycetota bacterium]|nr:MAG: cytochrome c [Planctomycetota bacterium]
MILKTAIAPHLLRCLLLIYTSKLRRRRLESGALLRFLPFTLRVKAAFNGNRCRSRSCIGFADATAGFRMIPSPLSPLSLIFVLAAGATLLALSGCGGSSDDSSHGDPQPTRSVRNLSPEQLFMHCRACHGATGQGITNINPPLDGSPYLEGDDANLARIILHGYRSGEWAGVMTGFAGQYSDDEVANLVNWMRARWAPQVADMTPETVAQVRRAEQQRRRPWSPEELAALRAEEPPSTASDDEDEEPQEEPSEATDNAEKEPGSES